MNRLLALYRRLRPQQEGAVIIEFALLAPVLIAMMLGILQLGFAVQNYNAVRNVSADVARYALIQYTTGHPLTNDAVIAQAESIAEGPPYLLSPSRLDVASTDVTSPQVTGTFEKTLTITYQIPTIFDHFGLHGPSISYSRSLIVPNS
jgi:Flp pilus assembly protein TadG